MTPRGTLYHFSVLDTIEREMNLFRGIRGPLRSLRTQRLSVINNLFPSVHTTSNKVSYYIKTILNDIIYYRYNTILQ